MLDIIDVNETDNNTKQKLTEKYITPEIREYINKMKSIPETINDNSPQRIKYRMDKAFEYYNKFKTDNHDRNAYIIIGLPSAGKSTIAEPLAKRTNSMILDSDIIKMGDKSVDFKGIREYNNGVGTFAVHEESSVISKIVLRHILKNGNSVVYPKVGGDTKSIQNLLSLFKEHNYNAELILNELPLEKALERNLNRFKETGRLVDPKFLIEVGYSPVETYEILKKEGEFDGYERYSNDVERGQKPILLESIERRGSILRLRDGGRALLGESIREGQSLQHREVYEREK